MDRTPMRSYMVSQALRHCHPEPQRRVSWASQTRDASPPLSMTKRRLCQVAIGRALRPFPRSKPSGPVSRHSAFRFGPSPRQGRINRCRLHGAPGGVCPPSSAFRSLSVCLPLDWLALADLHPVSAITVERLATTPPPPSVPRAGIFAPHFWARWRRSSPVPIVDVVAIRSCPLYAGCTVE